MNETPELLDCSDNLVTVQSFKDYGNSKELYEHTFDRSFNMKYPKVHNF